MNKIILVCSLLFGAFLSYGQSAETAPFSIGETLTFYSNILKEERIVNVYLPEGYHPDSSSTYPVIYLLDGSKDEDFIHVSGLVQFCSFSWVKVMPETIVVGIANVDRKRDFTYPSSAQIDQDEFPTSGGSESFITFIKEELKPLISKTYNTTEESTLIGQSLGGLLATEILINHSKLFDNYIIMSPSLWWDRELLLERQFKEDLKLKKVYIGVGKEGSYMERVAMELYTKLLKFKGSEHSYFQFFEDKDHGDVLHAGLMDAFGKLFSVDPK